MFAEFANAEQTSSKGADQSSENVAAAGCGILRVWQASFLHGTSIDVALVEYRMIGRVAKLPRGVMNAEYMRKGGQKGGKGGQTGVTGPQMKYMASSRLARPKTPIRTQP